MLELRDYQLAACENVLKDHARGLGRLLVVHPTGAGKTVTFSHLVKEREGRALVLVHRDELVGQTVEKMGLIAPELSVGIVKAARDETGADVVVASVQTVSRANRLARLGGFSTVVVDEAHHAAAKSWRRVLEHLGSFAEGPLTVGFTATPEREGTGLGVWQAVSDYRSIREMIYAGYLSPVIGQTVATEADFSGIRVSRGDLAADGLGEELARSGALKEIAAAYVRYAADRRSVAFLPTVATAKELVEELVAVGVAAEAVWGTQPIDERRDVLARLRSGVTTCVVNCAVLTEGFDEPAVDCIVVARPTRAHALYIQMVGRGMRRHPGKKDCLILDITGASERHDLIAHVSLGIAERSAVAKEPGDEGTGGSGECCELCGRELSAKLVMEGETRHPNCRASATKAVDVFATSKLRWLTVDSGFVLPAANGSVVMAPKAGGELWTLATYSSGGKTEILHRNLPIDWASGIGEDRAKAFGSLARRDARWLGEKPTERQLSRLVREGLPENKVGAVRTRGAAADLLTRIQGRRAMRKLARMMEN